MVTLKIKKKYRRYKRMCIVCKRMFFKEELLRFVRTNNGQVFVDFVGKINGRGSYVCREKDCCARVIKKRLLNKFLKGKVADDIYGQLQLQMNKE